MATIQISYAENQVKQKPKWITDLKKVVLGFLYCFWLELFFFLITATAIWFIWHAVTTALHLPPRQNMYLYSDQEVKYIVIVIGGMKRKAAVKRFLRKKIISQ